MLANTRSELELTLGEVTKAVKDAEQSVTYADRSGDKRELLEDITTHADALHQAGRRSEAETRFREAEQMQQESQPDYPLLYSVQGFRYCDLLLAAPERAAWQRTLECGDLSPLSIVAERLSSRRLVRDAGRPSSGNLAKESGFAAKESGDESPHSKTCRAVSQRAAQTLKWMEDDPGAPILTIALDHLTLGRAALYAAILERGAGSHLPASEAHAAAERHAEGCVLHVSTARRELDAAVAGLRRAGTTHHIPRALLTRAWLRFLDGSTSSPQAAPEHFKSAQEDLDEAWEIAERGPMKLFLADIHLHRARLFFHEAQYPWKEAKNRKGELVTNRTPKNDLDDAADLIKSCGYHRRDEELADAEAALREWARSTYGN